MPSDSFAARGTFEALGSSRSLYRLDAVPGDGRLPYRHGGILPHALRSLLPA
ncbi:hypothetical protein [Kitasatospora aureofaciens]|uniref:hypothetical protein n=1 Tax=Kitasatospora aureofaciens TaxID=1894 RepID=UPI0036F46A35